MTAAHSSGVRRALAVALLVIAIRSPAALAGPPFATDDPEPVPLHSWEVYLASQAARDSAGWSGTAPHFELNYGAFPETQLHLIVPLEYDAPTAGATTYGPGDVEVGVKYRLVEEGPLRPQVGTFPLLELPTGSERRNLGAGVVRALVPLWLQKSWGPWTSYGGGGYWIDQAEGHRDWLYVGGLVQRRVLGWFTIGGEVFHTTAAESGGSPETGFNVGAIADAGPIVHVIGSAGRGLQGGNRFQAYLALLLTMGPSEEGVGRRP